MSVWDRDDLCEIEPGDDRLDVPPVQMIDRLIRWHEKRAANDGRLALSCEAEGLTIAAETNRQRALAHRQTATCLRLLRQRCGEPETAPQSAFRGHLKPKARSRAEVRAPP
ncbi:hypothetical protein BHAOGJBA_1722 [Methylobacterium hispanicum]|uniref:Uncharacterized protein n=1 Tax=Methylobacterium hispanicum TaxID=270350 RepID=A0AAV4ZJD1_9HYPH|nr:MULTISPECIES: hypothetical protein [Methylobacterium]GJD88209.1 hypothetical protein BHAOGJBA_1722 [Methylobacterium hispanicum]